MTDIALPVAVCPKNMNVGPCGGVTEDHRCEIDDSMICALLTEPVRQQVIASERDLLARISAPLVPERPISRLHESLLSGRFTVIAEINGADSADASGTVSAAQDIAAVADVVSVTDHSGANVHMGNVAVSAHLAMAGIEVMTTFGCRDRNRMALQGDLLGVSSLGVRNVLCVTGNHVQVGDSHEAKPVFDLDSPRLLSIAEKLRSEGKYDNGRSLDVKPEYLLGATAAPFAPPYEERPWHVLRKVRLGADFVISQHIFDVERWNSFLAGVNALRADEKPFWLLGGVAVLPNEQVARAVNAGLRGFSIPESLLKRLKQAKDPQQEGILIAAELVVALNEAEGVAGCLIAPVTGRQNALAASSEQRDLIAEVRKVAGVPA
ncbi:methylenetetrahydrofolate reductase C-terminal domain-containing protein [Kineosporia babensis]|uniref:Methylenetetrahydrofolate reductase n=1 Tax=Kineosporia babensis TaxID=499548 RepID=A0A9X1NNL3_9ACTN|nr:methylenetetrahydrofolate reductase C-terminal domain-containing protein [Kineosporia babensis]MCD5317041.1 methylenetetrahydrofolate reductase C-terminal domain-containing protein [Kineosporia babensis]